MKWIKRLLAIGMLLILSVAMLYVVFDEKLPEGEEGPNAEALADIMLKAINNPAWRQTGAVEWDFDGRHRHVWDRKRHYAQVSWGNYVVQIDIDSREGIVLSGTNSKDLLELSEMCMNAWKYWANDSFWLNPVSKIRDEGTSRSMVDYNGEMGLMITYDKGGVTPGDSYLWFLDEDGLPYKWKMWVSIIPIGGISVSWEGWQELITGVKVATIHKNILTLQLSEIKAADTIEGLKGEDIFGALNSADAIIVNF